MFLHTYNFPNLNIGDNFAFETSLSETPDESAVVSLLLKINAEIQPKKRLGFLVFKLHRKALYPKEVFPFGEGLYESKHQKGIIRFDTDSWRINLLGKGIASALEYLLLLPLLNNELSVFLDPSSPPSGLRALQISKRGIYDGMSIGEYLQLLRPPSSDSQYFQILRPTSSI